MLSRLYSPEQFGSVALFVAFAGILGIASTVRFELAIALPASDDDAFNLLAVAMSTTLVVAGACALCALALREPLAAVAGPRPDTVPVPAVLAKVTEVVLSVVRTFWFASRISAVNVREVVEVRLAVEEVTVR